MANLNQDSNNGRSNFQIDDHTKFTRIGGCYITTKKAGALFILAVGLAGLFGILMYYYGLGAYGSEVLSLHNL